MADGTRSKGLKKGLVILAISAGLLSGLTYYLTTTDNTTSNVKEFILKLHEDVTPSSHKPNANN